MIDPFRNIQISLAGGGIASWMIVDQDQIQEIILSLWENSAVLTKTAQQLYLHRNSLQYKIDKWEELTGLQLKELTDLTLCYQLILPDII